MAMVKMSPDWCSDDAQELHVLAVDDSFVDRKVIERLLKISCCKVTAVESGRRALQYLGLDGEKSSVGFDDLKVNLIMTDFSMPGMTGFELLQKIKSSSKLKEIPVVIMSSENILSRVDRCLEEGAEDYLVKPVKLSDVQRIRDCILKGDEKNNATEITRKRNISDDLLSQLPAPSFLPSPASILASKQLARGASTKAKNERFHLFQCNRQMPPNCCDDTRLPQNALLLGNHKLHLVGSSSL